MSLYNSQITRCISRYMFFFAGRGADDFRKSSRPRARPSHMAFTYVGMVVGPGGVLSDEPDVVPGDQPAPIRDAAAAGIDGSGDRLLGRRETAEGIRMQPQLLEEVGQLPDEGGGALVSQVLPLSGAPT